ncbi:MAG: hypothetical protein MUF05_04470 [Candidatus Omnitrophica bacterium]|nr:hypothetical protein [Candidatus Omnitrophota bacterium]
MFGQGVAQNKNYLSFLEEGLNTKFPQKHWEIINTAVPGYNTVMEVETLAQKALRYHPDIVIIERIGNDLDLPNFIYEPDNWLDFRKSFFWGFINLKGLALQREFCLFDAPVVIKNGVFERFENNPKKLPAYCRNLVGKGPYKKAFYYLKFLSQKNHFIVISLLTIKPGHQNSFSYELSKKLGFYTTFNEVFDPAKDISLALNKNDRHPSEKGHMIIAKFLLGFMESEKIIDRFLLEK